MKLKARNRKPVKLRQSSAITDKMLRTGFNSCLAARAAK